jgi:hypothetical protein
MGGLCCCVDTKLPALARMTQSQKLLSREARVIGRRYASGRDSLDTDPFLFNFVALTEFLILRGLQLARRIRRFSFQPVYFCARICLPRRQLRSPGTILLVHTR